MNYKSSNVTGGCLCGSVRYESGQPPFRTGYCHCRMCQKSLGNIFGTSAFFLHEDFRFTSHEPQWYKSSKDVKRGFCGKCGSPIAYQHRDVSHIAIWVGTMDEPERFEPEVHWYSDTKIPWVDIHADLQDATQSLATYPGDAAD